MEFFHMWILKTNVAVGCHLVNLALEEVSLCLTIGSRMAAIVILLDEHFEFLGMGNIPVVFLVFLHLTDEIS